MKSRTALAKGDTLKMREAISQAILDSKINKPVDISEEVDELILDYSRRLKNFNFGSQELSKEEEKFKEIETQKTQNKLIQEVNELYLKEYPNHVIIPLSDLTKILHKYDLYSGSTRYYDKMIPQKNLMEMEDFWGKTNKLGFSNFDLNNLSNLSINSVNSISTNDHNDRYSRGDNVSRNSLQIIAPLNEFKLTKEEKVIGNFIVHDHEWDARNIKKPARNLDPIVWIPVQYPSIGGAALIITQWGPEADIPEFNQKIK